VLQQWPQKFQQDLLFFSLEGFDDELVVERKKEKAA
jgi:hypothetical protein